MADTPAGPTPEHPPPPPAIDPSVHTLLLDIVQQMGSIEGTQIGIVRELQDGTESRRRLHEKLDVVSEKAVAAAHRAEVAVTRAEHAVTAAVQAATAAAALKPSVDDYISMKGYVRVGLWALGLFVMPLVGLLGYFAVQLWQFIVAHIDLSRLWK
ncbi:MAG: hypothetical protein JWN58_1008 [Gammaproteobacteria bacterium]|nr:hypothetical protein [Gammaproteobacteria bacterium]